MHDRLEIASRLLAAEVATEKSIRLVTPADVRKILEIADMLMDMHDAAKREQSRPVPSVGSYPAQPRRSMFNAGDPVE